MMEKPDKCGACDNTGSATKSLYVEMRHGVWHTFCHQCGHALRYVDSGMPILTRWGRNMTPEIREHFFRGLKDEQGQL